MAKRFDAIQWGVCTRMIMYTIELIDKLMTYPEPKPRTSSKLNKQFSSYFFAPEYHSLDFAGHDAFHQAT
jgi:hypothetical protein